MARSRPDASVGRRGPDLREEQNVKITNVSTTPIGLPVEACFYETENAGTKREWGRLSRTSPKRPGPVLEYVIVRIETDEGITGVGEAPADIGFFGQTVEQVDVAVRDYMGPQLVGKDALDREHLMSLVDYRDNSCAKSGIELALYDLEGRARGVSVGDLLGGIHKKRIPVAIEIAGGPPEEMASACVDLVKQGVRAFKPKIGGYPKDDFERLAAIREAVGPEVSIRADANQGYTVEEAIHLCHLAEDNGIGLELLEQPVGYWDLDGMARVRSSVETLIEADESCYTVHDATHIIQHEAADVLNIKIAKAGGLKPSLEIAAAARDAGLQCVLGTAFGLGIKVAAKLLLAASLPDMVDAVEFTEISQHGNMLLPPHDTALALPLEDGCLAVPDGPGFGVEMDES